MYRKSVVVYDGDRVLGEAELQHGSGGTVWGGDEIREVRITHYSLPSERCPPLAVLHTIKSAGICFKLESAAKNVDAPLSVLHATCLRENKTAIASIEGQDIHLVAMHSRKYEGRTPCFWGFNVPSSLYNSCLAMLNLRCLAIVFDLDETLIVANTMRSFEDRIEALQRKISVESDPQRQSGMLAEAKRYHDDKNILKQYAENDQIIDNGKMIKAEYEVVLGLSDNHPTIARPLIRLPERNIILTRINPQIRDTSVLVRLRPAWEDLRNYLTAKSRKRFEVFVCTMAEKDYALEMWRLLDPESNLINPRELCDRIVCVKAGRKSLFNCFQHGNCHPRMALAIDDRLKVWEEQDQPRLHVVPAFMPYFAPQAEANNSVAVLCVARNVACNVRGGFFKEFDEGLMHRITEVAYEDDINDIPSPPDVSNYLVSEEDPSVPNGNKDLLAFDGMAGSEVERRLKEALLASSAAPTPLMNLDPRIASPLQYSAPSSTFTVNPPTIQGPSMPFINQQLPQATSSLLKPPVAHLGQAETTLQSSPAREEGEVPESELDPDTRRRLLILQHGQDMREHPPSEPQFPAQPPTQVPVPRVTPHGWFPVEEDVNLRQPNRGPPPAEFKAGSLPIDNHRTHHTPYLNKVETSIPPVRVLESQQLPKKEFPREDLLRINPLRPEFSSFSREDSPAAQLKDPDTESGQIDPYGESYIGALQDIALQCGARVELKQSLVSSVELQFSVEVVFAGQNVGDGIGGTRREALDHAAERSLLFLADKYLSQPKLDSNSMPGDGSKIGSPALSGETAPSTASTPPRSRDPRFEASKKSSSSITALKELCMMEGLIVRFHTQTQFSGRGQKIEVYAEVEINGQIMGKGIGLTGDDAKSQAAEKAIAALKPGPGQFSFKRQSSPRSMQDMPNKRLKPEMSRVLQRMPSSGRHPRNPSPIP